MPGCAVITDLTAPPQSGVSYVVHFTSNQLRWYRTDGEEPPLGGALELAGHPHDTTIDPVADLMAVAHDTERVFSLYQLDRPDGSDDAGDTPHLTATIDLGRDAPRRLAVDPARQ